jgi:phosphoribosylformylglycinamidine synthase
VASCISIERGGLGVAAAKSALAGMYGIELNLGEMKERDVLRNDIILYSESQGRFLVSVNPSLQNEFEECFKGLPLAKIGRVRDDQRVIITGTDSKRIINTDLTEMNYFYKKMLKKY